MLCWKPILTKSELSLWLHVNPSRPCVFVRVYVCMYVCVFVCACVALFVHKHKVAMERTRLEHEDEEVKVMKRREV